MTWPRLIVLGLCASSRRSNAPGTTSIVMGFEIATAATWTGFAPGFGPGRVKVVLPRMANVYGPGARRSGTWRLYQPFEWPDGIRPGRSPPPAGMPIADRSTGPVVNPSGVSAVTATSITEPCETTVRLGVAPRLQGAS